VDGGFGPLALVIVVVLAGVAAMLCLFGLLALVMFGGLGVLAIRGRIEDAKQRPSEGGPEEAW
jgi:hypothetical protein